MFRGRYIRLFLLWVDKPLTHYQIVDLEDIASLLMYRIKTVSKRRYVAMPYSSHLARSKGQLFSIVIFYGGVCFYVIRLRFFH